MERKTWHVYIFWEKKCFEVKQFFERVQRGFLSERKDKAIPYRGTEDRKGVGTNSGDLEFGARNLEAESIRSRAESKGWCVKLKTVKDGAVRVIHLLQKC